MLLATFQGKFVEDKLKHGDYVYEEYFSKCNSTGTVCTALEDRLGYKPIFCIPMTNKREFLKRLVISSPTIPQRFIIFESDDVDFVDLVSWMRSLYAVRDGDINFNFSSLVVNGKSAFSEYVVPRIPRGSVKEIINITDCENDIPFFGKTISDYSLDFIYSDKLIDLSNKYISDERIKLMDVCLLSYFKGEQFMDLVCKVNSNEVSNKVIRDFESFIDDNLIMKY